MDPIGLVLESLRLADVGALAAREGVAEGDLQRWRDAFLAGGRERLEALIAARAATGWEQLDLELGEGGLVRSCARLHGFLRRWVDAASGRGGWYVVKPPGLRLRVRGVSRSGVEALGSDLVGAGVALSWRRGLYEPELATFGGPTGVDLAHRWFEADTRLALAWHASAWADDAAAGALDLSLAALGPLIRATTADNPEAVDLWQRVAAQGRESREGPPGFPAEILAEARQRLERGVPLAGALRAPVEQALEALARESAALAVAHREAVGAGQMRLGLRALAASLVIFHWNRLGLGLPGQIAMVRMVGEVLGGDTRSLAPCGPDLVAGVQAYPTLLLRCPAWAPSLGASLAGSQLIADHRAFRAAQAAHREAGQRLAEALGAQVPGASRGRRRRLLSWRRDLHNGRALGGPDIPDELARWEAERAALEGAAQDGAAWDAAQARARGVLEQLAGDPQVRLALENASPSLVAALEAPDPTPRTHLKRDAALARYLWRASLRPTPFGLLAWTGRARLGDGPFSPPPGPPRVQVLGEEGPGPLANDVTRLLRGGSGPVPPELRSQHLDMSMDGVGRIPRDVITPFLVEVAGLASRRMRVPNPEQRVLQAVFEHIAAGATGVPLRRFLAAWEALCLAAGCASEPTHAVAPLGRLLGVDTADPLAPVAEALAKVQGEVNLSSSLGSLTERWPGGRAVLRLAPADDGPRRFCLRFWGADRMSLLPRYLSAAPEDRAAMRAWFARWPAMADLLRATARPVDRRPDLAPWALCPPELEPLASEIGIDGLQVAPHPRSGLPRLERREDGSPILPVFLGVSSPAAMSAGARLLMALDGRPPDLIEAAARAWSMRIAWVDAPVAVLPAATLGRSTLLCGPAHLLTPDVVGVAPGPPERADFLSFVGRMDDIGLPLGPTEVRAIPGGLEPLVVDLRSPLGLRALRRAVRGSARLLLTPLVESAWGPSELFAELDISAHVGISTC
ncbi:MAG: thiopeptide-type bacteriocin biosynthesis protein [Pseudomonadota bacterium]